MTYRAATQIHTAGSEAPVTRDLFTSADLLVSSERFEVTVDIVADNLRFDDDQALALPPEMRSAIQTLWHEEDFVWPTTVSVTKIQLLVEPTAVQESGQEVWSRVSILGTGWTPSQPVELHLDSALGFIGDAVELPAIEPTDTGFFGIDIMLKTIPRQGSDAAWNVGKQLALVANQSADDGESRTAIHPALPAHLLWQWTR